MSQTKAETQADVDTSEAGSSIRPEFTLLFDGDCRFCIASSDRLLRLARHGAVQAASFRAAGVLERFPAITADACERGIQLIHGRSGRVYSGAHAAFRALATRPLLAPLLFLYRLPGLTWLCDRVYAAIARRRFRIMGATDPCSNAACRPPG